LSDKRSDLPDFKDPAQVREYLASIEKATAAAQDYLNYLEQVAHDVRTKLGQVSELGNVPEELNEEASKAFQYLKELEETVAAAKDYLGYLKNVANSVREFLVDPQNAPLPEFAALTVPPPRVGSRSSPPSVPAPAIAAKAQPPSATISNPAGTDYLAQLGGSPVMKMPPRGKPKAATKGTGYLDNMGKPAPASALPSRPQDVQNKASFSPIPHVGSPQVAPTPMVQPPPPPPPAAVSAASKASMPPPVKAATRPTTAPAPKVSRTSPPAGQTSSSYLSELKSNAPKSKLSSRASVGSEAYFSKLFGLEEPSRRSSASAGMGNYLDRIGSSTPVNKQSKARGKPRVTKNAMGNRYLENMSDSRRQTTGATVWPKRPKRATTSVKSSRRKEESPLGLSKTEVNIFQIVVVLLTAGLLFEIFASPTFVDDFFRAFNEFTSSGTPEGVPDIVDKVTEQIPDQITEPPALPEVVGKIPESAPPPPEIVEKVTEKLPQSAPPPPPEVFEKVTEKTTECPPPEMVEKIIQQCPAAEQDTEPLMGRPPSVKVAPDENDPDRWAF
jgi:hypothetical protein